MKGLREPTCDRQDIHMPILLQGLQIKDRSPQPPENMSPGIYLFPVIFGPEETAIYVHLRQNVFKPANKFQKELVKMLGSKQHNRLCTQPFP